MFFRGGMAPKNPSYKHSKRTMLVDVGDRSVACTNWGFVSMWKRSHSGVTTSSGRQYQSKTSTDRARAARSRAARSTVSSWYHFAAAVTTPANLMDHYPTGAGGR